MEKLATDIYTFEDLRKKGFTYVDKTAQILPITSGEAASSPLVSAAGAQVAKFHSTPTPTTYT